MKQQLQTELLNTLAELQVRQLELRSNPLFGTFMKVLSRSMFVMMGLFMVSSALTVANAAGPTYFHAAIVFPWDNLLTDISDTLTGKTAKTLAIIGIVIAAIGLFTGQAGDGVKKLFVIILAVSIAIWAPTLVNTIQGSATTSTTTTNGTNR